MQAFSITNNQRYEKVDLKLTNRASENATQGIGEIDETVQH